MNTTSLRRVALGGGPREAFARATSFRPPRRLGETHVLVTPPESGSFRQQRDAVSEAYRAVRDELGLGPESAVFHRVFVSDVFNQRAELEATSLLGTGPARSPVARSVIEAPPLPGGKLALWAYHLDEDGAPLPSEQRDGSVVVARPNHRHVWTTGMNAPGASSAEQTRSVFDAYAARLAALGGTVADSAIRTWIFVRDIDRHYGGMVAARRERFATWGMTSESHYIASTGIEGRDEHPERLVHMDAYALPGLDQGQVHYLAADDHLGPTSDYGVTFERGVALSWGDRRQVLVSGTASIDPSGQVLHHGDVDAQLERTTANIRALLADANADLSDLAQLMVYLRDPADAARAGSFVEERYPGVPYLLLLAPICRPSWLVEIEGIALMERPDPRWPPL